MSISGWGNYPKEECTTTNYESELTLKQLIKAQKELIPRGNGRSYGDSALSKNIVNVKTHDHFISFDDTKGILHVQAGVLLSDIINCLVPRGWFLKITPGTKLITIGGAIASDVHGKNHHVAGCFSESIVDLRLMLPTGDIVNCSKDENNELFRATCGGMGLTGIILDAKISLKKINSKYINQTTIKTNNLKETFAAFEQYQNQPYSVAWIDCQASQENLGRCLLMVGDFCDDGQLNYQAKRNINIPIYFPTFTLNSLTIGLFNRLYYAKAKNGISQRKIGIDAFFYPLDAIDNWNRIYGKNGFVQYQFILPKDNSLIGLSQILSKIADSGKGSFLAVLKLYGKANENYLSFPIEGYSLALDFKVEKGLFCLLEQLDKIVITHGGRLYLAKDARVTQENFEQGYPHINKFRALRKQYKMDKVFNSNQSKRVGI